MSETTALIYSDSYQQYNFSPWHPMKPVRLLLTAELIKALGITGSVRAAAGSGSAAGGAAASATGGKAAIVEPRVATDDELTLVHDQAYVDKVRELSRPEAQDATAVGWGLGTGDNPVFPHMHAAAATIAGASLLGAEMIMAGDLDHAFNVAGGLHHAQKARASGFCIYNDAAIAIAWLRKQHGSRVAYLDVDAHHGDGVQNAFYHDPEVMTISFHESGRSLFPGTGFTGEIGEGEARGTSVNLPLMPYTGDEIFLDAWDEIVSPLVRAFEPDIIVTQDGCDGHWDDPLTHLSLTLQGYKSIWSRMHTLVHEAAGGRWLATGGGGYQAFSVVPRAWALLMAEIAGIGGDGLPEELPESWREFCERHSGAPAPRQLTGEAPPAIVSHDFEPARAGARTAEAEIKEKIFPIWMEK